MSREEWIINIEDIIVKVTLAYGKNVALATFARYDSSCLEDLSPVYYGEVFSDLMQLYADT